MSGRFMSPKTLALALAFSAASFGLAGAASAQENESESVPWYTELGAFGEIDRDLDPMADEPQSYATGLGAEVRLGRALTPNLDADAGLRLGGAVESEGYVLGTDVGLRLHPDTFVAPYLGVRLGYTRIGGSFRDVESRSDAEGRTTQDSVHFRPELGLSLGRTDTLRVLLGVTLNYRLFNRYNAQDSDGVPLSRESPTLEANGLAGTMARLAVAVEL